MTIVHFQTTPKNSKEYVYTEHSWDLNQQLKVEEFKERTCESWEKHGSVISAKDRAPGYKILVSNEHLGKTRLIYLMVIDGYIVKAGKVKEELDKRSYAAGTEKSWTVTGKASETNYVYSQIFRACLRQGIPVDFYCLECPKEEVSYTYNGEIYKTFQSPYEDVEKRVTSHLQQLLTDRDTSLIGERNLLEQHKK